MRVKSILALAFSVVNISCFSQSWQWTKQIGSSSVMFDEFPTEVFCDGPSIYLIGAYGGKLLFPTDSLSSNGYNDSFIAKFEDNGSLVWIRTLGGASMSPSHIERSCGAFDTINHQLYLSGSIFGPTNFGNGINLTPSLLNNDAAFLAKFDSSGLCLWAKLFDSPGDDFARCFLQPDGNILVAGELDKDGLIDSQPIDSGGFFARFDPNGNLLWAEQKFMGPEVYPFGISFIGEDIIMTGYFNYNNSIIDTSYLALAGVINGFLTRLDSLGHVKWIQTFDGPGINGSSGICIDQFSNIYITGGFQDSIQLGNLKLYDTDRDFFLAKFDDSGSAIWVAQGNCDGNIASGFKIVSDQDGNCILIGSFSGNAQFGSFNVSASNQTDMLIAKYNNSTSACIGVRNFGLADGYALAVDNNRDIVCTGTFRNTINIGGTILSAYQGSDIFIAKSDEIVGLEEDRQFQEKLVIYANPNRGTCTILVPDDLLNSKGLILSVYDHKGEIIQQTTVNINSEKISLNIDHEANGIYRVKLGNRLKSYFGTIIFE
ncbi:MAG TPA: T9SS type A sorting domain-containing protein [Bacteroidia bacterium]|nr:T9SS type A sorting domain-containing protein [Bacteroidia bacterium]